MRHLVVWEARYEVLYELSEEKVFTYGLYEGEFQNSSRHGVGSFLTSVLSGSLTSRSVLLERY